MLNARGLYYRYTNLYSSLQFLDIHFGRLQRLSELLRWQKALDVPLADLLVETDGPLSEPIMTRARLLRIMKTVRAIKETATSSSIQRFATMLEQQLVELMPELKDVAAWHSIGQRRSPNELVRTAERVLPDTFFHDSMQ
jgi:Tat protein secretion system quality control protein TatD with DNase activity